MEVLVFLSGLVAVGFVAGYLVGRRRSRRRPPQGANARVVADTKDWVVRS